MVPILFIKNQTDKLSLLFASRIPSNYSIGKIDIAPTGIIGKLKEYKGF